MMYHLYWICYFFVVQTSATSGAGGGTPAPTASAPSVATTTTSTPDVAAQPSMFDSLLVFLPAMMAVMLVYFIMMSRPQKKNAKTSERLKNLKKNDRVVTAGGILGTVVNIRPDSEYTTIRIDDSSNAKMQVLTVSIIRVLSDETEKES